MTALLIGRKYGDECRTTLFEASDTLGGKLRTRSFGSAPVPYEAGAAECYDYSALGHDPLRALVEGLGLTRQRMHGQTVILDGTVLRSDEDIGRHWGAATMGAIRDFRRRAAELLPIDRWHPGSWRYDSTHAWSHRTCDQLLDTVTDPVARKYLSVAAHSDLATEPHLTSGLNGLKNFVMDVPGYVEFYAIEGGMGALGRRLAGSIPSTDVECNARVVRIERTFDGEWRVRYIRRGHVDERLFDAVVVALPASQLGAVEYAGDPLRRTMGAHIARFDRPGHYLRVSLLFRSPFWHDLLSGSWFMIDAFGGACVYDESARYDAGGYGVLGFLVAGNDALAMMNVEQATVVQHVVDTLPGRLRQQANELLVESRIHRWCGGVSGLPGGLPTADPRIAHEPDANRLPGLFVVGDYLFDSTLNGVYRSADLASTLLSAQLTAETAATAA
jgi:monoamine oxidase